MRENDYAIRVHGLCKLYRLGVKEQMSESFAGAMWNTVKRPLSNFRKYKSLYNFDDVLQGTAGAPEDNPDVLWALRDVSFDVERGEAIGVIGRNGAGKSTLLKVLSRITHPSAGRIELDGRVSSLLEVGTGFHPELTGRDNIYLNGTVLGMKKSEVDRKLDEIIEFSGVERFLNTPVKRYSSGMTVRLAFSVAAHLDPEILIIDEVLAVGDAAFQKKCIGKMQDAARLGRTVIFVSHNMAAVSNLCSKAIYLKDGQVVKTGDCDDVIEYYLASVSQLATTELAKRTDRDGLGEIKITDIELLNAKEEKIDHPQCGRELIVRLHYTSFLDKEFRGVRVHAMISKDEVHFINLGTDFVDTRQIDLSGNGYLDFIIPKLPLTLGNYQISTFLEVGKEIQDSVFNAVEMQVIDGDFYGTGRSYPPSWAGKYMLVEHSWRVSEGVS